jgi:phospholipase/carboxylesterase
VSEAVAELVHVVREAAGEPDGALILNHGRGADQHDLLPLLEAIDPEHRLVGITTGAPLTDVPPGGRHWYLVPRVGYPDHDTFHASLGQLTGFADGFLAERGIGWDRTVIGGFSMGAVMSYSVALGPGRPVPAGLIALSGFIPSVDGWQPELGSRRGLPVLIHHGEQDPVISVEFARRARELLEAGGLHPQYTETDAGHWLPPEIVPALRDFTGAAIPVGVGRRAVE